MSAMVIITMIALIVNVAAAFASVYFAVKSTATVRRMERERRARR